MFDRLTDPFCSSDEDMLFALKMQHKQECKGLIVQIKYLKAKFTRESCLRYDLGYQKKYLLTLLSRCERT
jgi:myosin protein heavy chain